LIVDVRYTRLLKIIGSPDTAIPEASTWNVTEPIPPDKSEARVRVEKKAVLPRREETNIPETSLVRRLRELNFKEEISALSE
jgi:hypothetical protein